MIHFNISWKINREQPVVKKNYFGLISGKKRKKEWKDAFGFIKFKQLSTLFLWRHTTTYNIFSFVLLKNTLLIEKRH